MRVARKRQKQIGCAIWTKEMLIQEGKGFRKWCPGWASPYGKTNLPEWYLYSRKSNLTFTLPVLQRQCFHNEKFPWNKDFNTVKKHGVLLHNVNVVFSCTNQAWETKGISIFHLLQFSASFIGVENQWIHFYHAFSRLF